MFSRNGLAGLAGALLFLAGCFASDTPLIASQSAVLPVDGKMTVCLAPDDPCLALERKGDGYFAESPDEAEPGVGVRFAPLVQAGGRQVFIAETAVQAEEGTVYTYGLARRLGQRDARGATLQVAAADCEDLDEDALASFRDTGGTVDGGKVTDCQPVSLDQLKAALLAAYQSGLADDAWWQQQQDEF